MDPLFRETVISCRDTLQKIAGNSVSTETSDHEKSALADALPRLVKYVSMLPGPDRLAFMPICGGIRRIVYVNDITYLDDTLKELGVLLSAVEKGTYRAIRETPENMLWACIQNSLIRLRNLRHCGFPSHPSYETERALLREELERYRRYVSVGRLTLPQRQAHEFVLKGLGRVVTEGETGHTDPVESKLVSMLVES